MKASSQFLKQAITSRVIAWDGLGQSPVWQEEESGKGWGVGKTTETNDVQYRSSFLTYCSKKWGYCLQLGYTLMAVINVKPVVDRLK